MAVAPTGAIYKALKFDNVSSRTYGVYITGEAVYNAPERDVEMITIPGRNGSFALDNGRFENIEVSYPAGIFADTEVDFRQAISDFRNFLCSRNGYVRLQDEYNPDEYRMAVYKSGLEVDPAMLKAGEFKITFDCKPQRWLTSGETEVTIASSGDTITNPTLFGSQPLLAVKGYGTINMGDYEIELDNGVIGNIQLFGERQNTVSSGASPIAVDCGTNDTYDTSLVQNGDTISLRTVFAITVFNTSGNSWAKIGTTIDPSSTATVNTAFNGFSRKGVIYITFPNEAANNLTAGSSNTKTCSATLALKMSGGTVTDTVTASCTVTAVNGKVYASMTASISGNSGRFESASINMSAVTADSTVSRLGNPTYLDCETGEAYKIENDNLIGLNSFIAIGADLPVLSSGANTITYDNTVTELKITPRWWKI